MNFVDSIGQLDYYTNPPDAPCYCETLVYASDLVLQPSFISNASSGFTVLVNVLSASGTTTYEDATSYFEYYFFDYGGVKYLNLRLKSYSPAMCTYGCWILQVKITLNNLTLFNKYTQRYCQASCCDVPRGTIGTVDGNVVNLGVELPSLPTSQCGYPLIRIESNFDCLNNQDNSYYGIPEGQTWGFNKILNIPGKIVERPREISRQISYNCNLQRAESFRPYLLESIGWSGVFPAAKMREIEDMFHAPRITITNYTTSDSYQFAGGVICEKLTAPCWEIFKIRTTVQSCITRQIFGCDETCPTETISNTFLIPENFQAGFYDQNRQLISEDYPGLITYFEGQNSVTSVTDVSGDYDNVYAALQVNSTSYVTNQLYYNSPVPKNKIFGRPAPISPVVLCSVPILENRDIDIYNCATPVLTNRSIVIIPDTPIAIADTEFWTQDGSQVIVAGGVGDMYIKASNFDLGSSSPAPYINSQIIGVIDIGGRPAVSVNLTNTDNNNIPADSLVQILPDGKIYYSGYPTDYEMGAAVVELTDILFNIT